MAKKLTQKQLSALRDDYITKREELLIKKVDGLSIKLFDRVFESYLAALENADGKLVKSDRNFNMVKGLDEVYKLFRNIDNVPVVKRWVGELQDITPLNERYFQNIAKAGVRTQADVARQVVDKRLGIEENGSIKQGGFVDKFIRDERVLKRIKKMTNQAITKGTGFQQFRQDLKEYIEGNPKLPMSGGLQQYYRNYAYDTYRKVDRINQDTFAKELGLRYFYWSGGKVATTRPLCLKCYGKIVDSLQYRDLTYDDIKEELREGLPNGNSVQGVWNPMRDLGGFGCIHSKDFIADEVAQRNRDKWLNIDIITG